MADEAKTRSFLFTYVKEHLRDIPQPEAVEAIGYRTYEAIFDGNIGLFSVANLIRILNQLGIDQKEVLESARFHSSLRRR